MWLAVDLDDTLLSRADEPEPGAIEAMTKLLEEGHRVTIWTARFARIHKDDHSKLLAHTEAELKKHGIPYTDICTGPKPPADVFIGDNVVPYSGNWPQTLAQAHMQLETRGSVDNPPLHEYEEGAE